MSSIVERIWGGPVLERIGAPNLIRQSLSGGEYPAHLHIDVLRHQLYEIMLEALQSNNPSLLEYATSKLDGYASFAAPVTDPVVRSTAYIAHTLNMPFISKYDKFTSDHNLKSFYFATVLEKTLYLTNLHLFDQMWAVRCQYGFNIEILDNSKALHQNTAFKMATILTSRNEMQRLKNCSELYDWCIEKSTTNIVFIERMMVTAAQSGALEAFVWILENFKKSKMFQLEISTKNLIRIVSNTCIKNNHMELFEYLFESLPEYRRYIYDRLDDFDNKIGLSALVGHMDRLNCEDLNYLVSNYSSTSTLSDTIVKDHAKNLLQRKTLEQHVPSISTVHRRKV